MENENNASRNQRPVYRNTSLLIIKKRKTRLLVQKGMKTFFCGWMILFCFTQKTKLYM